MGGTCSTHGEMKSAYNTFQVRVQGKAKQSTMQVWTDSEGCRSMKLSELQDNHYMKVARLSALGTGRLYPTEDTHFFQRLSRFHRYSVAGRIKYMKIRSNPTGNRTRDIRACIVVPQPDAFQLGNLRIRYDVDIILILKLMLTTM